MMSEQYLTSVDYKDAYPAKDMVELLIRNSERYAGKDLYYLLEDGITETERITHDEAFVKARSVAAELQAHGSKGDRVLLLFPTGLEFVISLFACFLSGKIAVPAYPPHRRKSNQRFFSIIDDANPSIILTTDRIHGDLEFIEKEHKMLERIVKLTYGGIRLDQPESWVNPGISKDDIAFLQYTSGSTGSPNGVMVSHGNIIHNSECIKRSFGFDEHLRGINWLPNFHDMGLIGCLIQPAYVGGMNIIIPPLKFLQSPLNWYRGISKYRATNAGGPNFAYDYSAEKVSDEDIKDLDLSSISTLYCGAEPIRAETFDNFTKKFKTANFRSVQFYPCYGLAESVLIASGGDFKLKPIYYEVNAKALEKNKVIPVKGGKEGRILTACGYPWMGMSISIIDPDTRTPAPINEIGEIWLNGPSVAKGYWNDPEGTEKTFNASIVGKEGSSWLRTGDLGFIHDGQLYVTGRLKDLIIIRGSNFFPNDIEYSAENSNIALRKNASAAFSADIDGEEKLILLAEVERSHMHDLVENEIFEDIRSSIFAEHGIQAHALTLVRPGSTLKTSSGKIQRFAMKKAWINDELNVLASWTMKKDTSNLTSEIGVRPEFLREWMINWMAQQLELDPGKIDPDKPVSAYGLDSITAVSLERDVNKQFGVEWPIESFLKENSVNMLVEEGIELLREKK